MEVQIRGNCIFHVVPPLRFLEIWLKIQDSGDLPNLKIQDLRFGQKIWKFSGTFPRNDHFVLKFSFHRRSEILPDERQNTATFFSSASALMQKKQHNPWTFQNNAVFWSLFDSCRKKQQNPETFSEYCSFFISLLDSCTRSGGFVLPNINALQERGSRILTSGPRNSRR